MATIKPFKALRFTEKAGGIDTLVCPPYDIISEEQRLSYIAANENNVIRLELPKDGADVYAQAGDVLKKWTDDGILKCDGEDALYIYEIIFKNKGESISLKGFICRVKLHEFSEGIILPHEETLSKAKTDRFNLMTATHCNFSQIYSLYMDEKRTTDKRLNEVAVKIPDITLTDGEGLVHNLWIVTDKSAVDEICDDFKERKLYIADGHHRYETALNFHKANPDLNADSVMMMLVSMEHEGLLVLPTHRIIRDLDTFDLDKTLSDCEKYFIIEKKSKYNDIEKNLESLYNKGIKAFCLYAGNDEYYLLILKSLSVMDEIMKNDSYALRHLDVSVLHSLILERIFGIDKENMANQINLTYTKYADEAISAVDKKTANCAFIMNPTRVSEIRDVASAGEKMPQKSTYFYPKLITGMVINRF